ncbi:6-phosphogluconolactonase [Leucosporidium creatinivorum]|uniref:6-phosphogluconolactonase n=1 Tax=Leucosporidium creatinivorum TaxID=106004 RepID=A0A1Y2G174_9BASI|nr:6-phosphogluconolactonase [Leucosporidium creatinivorum]
MIPPPVVYAFPTPAALSAAGAKFILEAQNKAIEERGVFSIAFSGGDQPEVLSSGLLDCEGIQWSKWQVWLADERLVPLGHQESNYRLNMDELFSKTPINPSQVHATNPELLSDPDACAKDYEARLREAFKGNLDDAGFPRFDIVLIGMGPDGHTCSLFPSHPLLNESSRWVTFLTDSPKPPPVRITLTYPSIASARNIVSLGYGFDAATLKRVLEKEDRETGLPAARIKSSDGSPVLWFIGEGSTKGLDYPVTPL